MGRRTTSRMSRTACSIAASWAASEGTAASIESVAETTGEPYGKGVTRPRGERADVAPKGDRWPQSRPIRPIEADWLN